MRNSLWIIAALFVVMGAPSVLRADDITYTVNQAVGSGSVTGFITTDGTIGTLSIGDIVSWNLTLNDGHGDVTDLTQLNSAVGGHGTDLTASSSDLMFNFDYDTGIFSFSSTTPASVGQLCYDAGTDCAIPQGIDLFDVAGVIPCAYWGCSIGESGNQVIASVATPEPSSFISLGVGLAGLVLCGWVVRKRRAPGLEQAT